MTQNNSWNCSQELIDELGVLVDRMSINIELPSQIVLIAVAPDKV